MTDANPLVVDAVIVGAGISGLYMAHKLHGLGLEVRGFEAAPDVGGTWFWNKYPGARCDSESITYCYTFDHDLQQEWDWTERYPAGPDVLRYLRHVADRFDLRRHFAFETTVVSAVFDESSERWTVTTDRGEVLSAQYFISAVGNLSVPSTPAVEGIETFEGRWLHTGRWPEEPIDFTGLEVAVIGTGSSGIQVSQAIAKTAKSLTVFQRTPTYTIPLRNLPLDPDVQRLWKANYPQVNQITRNSPGGLPFAVGHKSLLDATPEERERGLEAGWQLGGFRFMFGTFDDITSNLEANKIAADFVKRKIAERVRDPETAKLLTPEDYPLGAKRIPLETDYLDIYNQDNVRLVSLRESPLRRITPHGLIAGEEEHRFDLIVFATGFDAITGPLLRIDVRGRDGLRLADVWADGARTYVGLTVAGFPNLFVIGGPSSPGVISNVPPTLEQHVEWVADQIETLRDAGIATIEAEEIAQDEWVAYVHSEAQKTMYPYATSSWYDGSNLTGKVRPFPVYTGGFDNYRKICDAVVAQDFLGFRLTRQDHRPSGYGDFSPTVSWFAAIVEGVEAPEALARDEALELSREVTAGSTL